MASLIGINTRTGGIKQIPSRVGLYSNGVGLGPGEQHPDTITIVRDTRAFPDGEAPPDWRTYDGSDWPAFGQYWYAIHDAYWQLNPADFYQITNEQGGGEGEDVAGNYEQLVKVERAIMQAANADGCKCAVLNLAGGSPGDFEIWKAICAPFIVEAWETGGNLYGRHCYADWFVEDDGSINNGQPQRVISELEYLRSIGYGGGMVLTECGLYGGYGLADYDYFEQQVTRWEQALRPYADIFIGLAWWETGASEFNADYTDHLKQLLPYIEAGDLPRWTPPIQPPDNGGNTVTTIKKGAHITHLDTLKNKRVPIFQERKWNAAKQGFDLVKQHILDIDLADETSQLWVHVEGELMEDEPSDPKPPPVVLTLPRGSKGVDLSNYQAGFFDVVDPDEFDFYIFRCSDGMNTSATSQNHDANGVDKSLWTFADVGHASGKPWGIYHFLRPGNVEAQISKVRFIYEQLVARGMPPRTAVFDDGKTLAGVWADIEDANVTNAQVKQFCAGVGVVATTGIYTGYYIWNAISDGIDPWWSNKALWVAAYSSANDGTVPNWPNGPFVPDGWQKINIWQYSSEGQNVTDWNKDGLDMNIVGPYPPTAKQPDPPTLPDPTGKTINFTNYLIPPSSSIGPFLVFEKAAGGTIDHQVQVQNGIVYVVKRAAVGTEYEELRISNGFIERRYDTSPADGLPYKLDDGYGWSKWMPVTMTEGQYYKRSPRVTKYDVANNCQLVADQGISESYIYFAKYHDSYDLPGGKVKTAVCELHWLWAPGGTVLERYFLAENCWYIMWGNGDALHYLNEEPQGREPLSLSPVACLK